MTAAVVDGLPAGLDNGRVGAGFDGDVAGYYAGMGGYPSTVVEALVVDRTKRCATARTVLRPGGGLARSNSFWDWRLAGQVERFRSLISAQRVAPGSHPPNWIRRELSRLVFAGLWFRRFNATLAAALSASVQLRVFCALRTTSRPSLQHRGRHPRFVPEMTTAEVGALADPIAATRAP